jgi:hypothetical protein
VGGSLGTVEVVALGLLGSVAIDAGDLVCRQRPHQQGDVNAARRTGRDRRP